MHRPAACRTSTPSCEWGALPKICKRNAGRSCKADGHAELSARRCLLSSHPERRSCKPLTGSCCCSTGLVAQLATGKPAVAKLQPPRKQPRPATGAREGSAPRSGLPPAPPPEAAPPPREQGRAAGGGTAAGGETAEADAPTQHLAPVHYLATGAQRGRRLGELNLAACSSFRCSACVSGFKGFAGLCLSPRRWKAGRNSACRVP